MQKDKDMETVGKFEFSRKDLIGHGAFAVVFKGRHKEKPGLEVAVKCINKKNLAKSQTLLGKEIKILKELKHENIVALYDFQEMANSVYLVMEYCNGGDLADYLHTMRTLSEDTIRLFLQQIAGAMKMLHSKGIIHRDLKPQNILLSYAGGKKSNPNNIRIKIADFGFARYLQSNMMAATLCGSPMYMAPEVIMSQHYDAKADLWSIGTIIYQCLTGKAPFQASSPQDLRLFYEKNKMLMPNIPRETSSHLRQLLLGLLQRNHKDRMDFDEFFHHPFLDASASMKKCDRTTGRKRFFWFRATYKPARPLPPAAPSPCEVSPAKRGCPTGGKGLCLLKETPKPSGRTAQATPPLSGTSPSKPDCPADKEGLCLPREGPKPARPASLAMPPLWGMRPSESDLPTGRQRFLQPWLAHPPAQLSCPAALSPWRASPVPQGTPHRQERILLTCPPFPASPTPSECGKQAHCHRKERVLLAQPSTPTAPRLLMRGTGPVQWPPLRAAASVPMPSYPSSGSGSSSSSSSTSHLASPPQSLGEMQQLREKALVSPAQDSPGFLHGSKDSAGSSSKNSSCDTDDFVMVPAQFSSDITAEAAGGKPVQDSLMYSESSLVTSAGVESQARTPSPSPPYNTSPSPAGSGTVRRSSSTSPLGFAKIGASPPFSGEHGAVPSPRRFSFGGAKPYTPSPQVGTIPEQPGQTVFFSPPGAETRSRIPMPGASVPEHSSRGMGCRLHSAPNLSDLHSCRQKITKQHSDPLVAHFGHAPISQPLQVHGLQPCRQLRSSPKLSEFMQRSPLPTILGSPTKAMSPFEFPKTPSSQNLLTLLAQQRVMMAPTRNRTLPDLKEMGHFHCQQTGLGLRPVEEIKGRSLSTGRLTDLLLKAAFGAQISEAGSNDSLNNEKPMEITAPPAAYGGNLYCGARAGGSLSSSPVVFTVGSPPSGTTPPQTTRTRMFSVGSSSSLSSGGSFSGRHLLVGAGGDAMEAPSSLRYTLVDPIAANLEGAVTFEAPELPEETLMEQEHTDILRSLRFMLAFVHYVMEIATIKGSTSEMSSSVASEYQLQESMVADQISLLSREWSYAEQLVLYLKVAELLSSGLQTAIEQIKAGKLCLSSTVKQVVKKLNELYKSSVSACHSLNMRLQRFFLDKQKLMDRINSITAEKLIFSYAVQMVQSAALDEMFHHREDCTQRYQKALLLMEGLLNIITEQGDIENINKCKMCIERRLSALLSGICA
ncbi:serine/threonine-protein kinase ULK1 isoform X3 [Gopherus flavomarginatus]|uniref:serine/threonine-protein kinase ULK1 isoform X3 n=1 Tax=Gopherus flavomarginatus TaxID=286002 RepID=UPI0021CC414E|nr:serine/threonine-protein kinase ULK1 isoform X3 [Gopherus flavomarginatus]